MNSTVLTVQLRVGTTAFAPEPLKQILTIDAIEACLQKSGLDYTLTPATGSFHGEREKSAIVDLIFVSTSSTLPMEVFNFCESVQTLISTICADLVQKCIIATVTVADGRRDIRWSRATSFSPPLNDPPFLFPSLVARHTLPEKDFGLSVLLRTVADHFEELGVAHSDASSLGGVPEVCVLPALPFELEFDGKNPKPEHFEGWDRRIIEQSREVREIANKPVFDSQSDFISLFRSVSRRPVYYASSLSSLRSNRTHVPIRAYPYEYYTGTGSCEGMYLKTLDAWLRAERNPKKLREYLSVHRTLDALDNSTLPMIGITSLMLLPDGNVLINRRGATVGSHPNVDHLVPSGMVEPFPDYVKPSVALTFLREVDEELFGAPDSDETVSRLLEKEHIRSLRGSLVFLGCGIDLMRQDVNILLRFRPDTGWWDRYKDTVRLNWEYSEAVPRYEKFETIRVRAAESPTDFVPATASTIRLCEQFQRRQET